MVRWIAATALGLLLPHVALAKPALLETGALVGDSALSPFYQWTEALPSQAGRLLRSEAFPVDLTPANAGHARRFLYTTQDWRWRSGIVAATGVLYLPKGPAPKAGWSLIVWAHGTLGMADACAPSWTGANLRDRAYIDRWLEHGFAVAAPDYQGLGGPGPHPYTLWQVEGRSVLDAARAALRLDRRIANRMIITGQSQGSGAALGAARLATGYAPELRIKGTIATALLPYMPGPTTPPEEVMPGGSPYYMIYRMLGGGLTPGAPPMDALLTAKGQLLLDAARTGCQPRLVAAREDITMDNAFTRPEREINQLLGPAGLMPPFTTRIPLLLGTGLADELIAPSRQMLAVRALCKAGNRVTWKGYAASNHSDTLTRSFDDALQFAKALFSGERAATSCGALPS